MVFFIVVKWWFVAQDSPSFFWSDLCRILFLINLFIYLFSHANEPAGLLHGVCGVVEEGGKKNEVTHGGGGTRE